MKRSRQARPVPAELPGSRALTRSARLAAALCALLVGLAGVAVPACATDTEVYRCRDAAQQVTYTDSPCPGGDRVALKPGTADPEALRRLALARAELDRSAAQRRVARVAEEARSADAERMRRLMEERDREDRALETSAAYDGAGWYSPYDASSYHHQPRTSRARPRNRGTGAHRGAAPHLPAQLPQR